jgi:hypothetical protein
VTLDEFCKAEAIPNIAAQKLVTVLNCIFMTPHHDFEEVNHGCTV